MVWHQTWNFFTTTICLSTLLLFVLFELYKTGTPSLAHNPVKGMMLLQTTATLLFLPWPRGGWRWQHWIKMKSLPRLLQFLKGSSIQVMKCCSATQCVISHSCILLYFCVPKTVSGIVMAIYLFITYHFTAQVLKVCRTPGPTDCSKTKLLVR